MQRIGRAVGAASACVVTVIAGASMSGLDIARLEGRTSTAPAPPEVVARIEISDAEMASLLTATTRPAVTTADPTTADPTTTTTRPPTGSGRPVTFAFGGDVHFEGFLRDRLANETSTFLDPVAALMADADVAMVNLETVVSTRGVRAPKQFTFRTTPRAYAALESAGIDVATLANNHGLDYGMDGLEDTIISAAEAEFPIVGIGRNATEAYAPWITEINGQRIGIIGATQVLDTSLIADWTATDEQAGLASAKEVERLVRAVTELRSEVDTLVVYLHWGVEGTTCPAPRQEALADELVVAGADIIVGGHAHRVLGGGLKNDAVVHYGLGNLVFYRTSGPSTESGVLHITATGRRIDRYEWVPGRLQGGVATELNGDAAQTATAAWERLRACTDLTP